MLQCGMTVLLIREREKRERARRMRTGWLSKYYHHPC